MSNKGNPVLSGCLPDYRQVWVLTGRKPLAFSSHLNKRGVGVESHAVRILGFSKQHRYLPCRVHTSGAIGCRTRRLRYSLVEDCTGFLSKRSKGFMNLKNEK